ncbi:MAG: hypothetical protein HY608_05340 [Planctomycetes bacterium]|nr:hypothetical protein [Planctomycetota bacterium]
MTARPAGGWTSWEALRNGALGASQAKLDRFRPYLALRGWVDKKVIVPNVQASIVDVKFRAWAEIRTGTRDDGSASGMRLWNMRTSSYAPGFERDSAGTIVGRAPVEINWAIRNPPVLRALLSGLEGVYLSDRDAAGGFQSRPYRVLIDGASVWIDTLGIMQRVSLTGADVDEVVAALAAHSGFDPAADRYPHWDGTAAFDSWEEFAYFVERKLTTLSRQKKDILLANFNPNSQLNKSNPNLDFFREVDKSDLLAYSTEFSFRPLGEMQVESLGRLTDAGGALLARRSVRAAILDSLHLRFTAQSEFVAGDGGLGKLDEAGDETNFRAPGEADFLGAYQGPGGVQGFGAKFLGNDGLALQTYPEPQWGPGSPAPAPYDGSIQLATLETVADPAVEPGLRFLASWGDRLDADFAPGGKTATPDMRLMGAGTMDTSLWGRSSGNTLVGTIHPDGLYSEDARAPGYLAKDNLNGIQGAVSFWVKPNYDLSRTEFGEGGRGHLHLNLSHLSADPEIINHQARTQIYMLGAATSSIGKAWLAFWETRHTQEDTGFEHRLSMLVPEYPLPHRWYLNTFYYNFLASAEPEHGVLTVDGGRTDTERNGPESYTGTVDPSGAEDISSSVSLFEPDGKARFYMGFRGCETVTNLIRIATRFADADATMDEFAFLDMVTSDASRNFAQLRYQDGRYYKGADGYVVDDAVYTSAEIALAPGSVIQGADTTFVLPRYDSVDDPNYVFHKAPNAGDKRTEVKVRIVDSGGTEHDTFPVALGDGRFRYKIEIFPNVEDTNDPLISSPILDDVTFHITSPSGVRIVSWEEPAGN